jgi:uncharacterized damage-inducible protein DinB
VDLSVEVTDAYLRRCFERMVDVAERLGDDLVNGRPVDEDTNSVAALVVHCCGVCEYWLGHVGLGRSSTRDRDAEFRATATVDELRSMVSARIDQNHQDVRELDLRGAVPGPSPRDELPVGDVDASIVLHVVEEVFQHLGHMDVTADAVLARRG